jgi:hypothetical protein
VKPQKRPILLLVLLSAALLLLAVGGIYGGYNFILDPSGASMQMPLSALERTPFSDYRIPGFILMFAYGFGGLVSLYGLWSRASVPLLSTLERWTHEHWAWDLSLALGVILLIWLTYQVFFYTEFAPIQVIMYVIAVLLIGLPLLNPVRNYYREETP